MNSANNVDTAVANTKKPYEMPLLVEQAEMIFPKEILENFADSEGVFQCFHCNCKGD